MRTNAHSVNRGQPSRKSAGVKQSRHNKSGQAARFDGMHHRRDKRYPLAAPRIEPVEIEESFEEDSATDEMKWKEALMLWLSWNRTYEKVTARMCKPGQDQVKLESLLDEMDHLRRQAIDLSETLIA